MYSVFVRLIRHQKSLKTVNSISCFFTTKATTATHEKVDVIILGATGFTGKYIAEECVRQNCFSWTIAGRNPNKMHKLMKEISSSTGVNLTDKKVIIADCNTPESLSSMAQKGKIIINCVGPYRYHGEDVVKACVQNGTHYLDITGEPEFMEKVQLTYHELAQAKSSYVVSSCGMDSIPVDIGVLHFAKNFDGVVNFVETYMKQSVKSEKHKPFINYTTWECAVHGFANVKSLLQTRKKLFSKWKVTKPEPRLPYRSTVHLSQIFDNKISIPFPGADRSVVVRSQMYFDNELHLRPIQSNSYLVCDSKLVFRAMSVVLFFIQTLIKYEFGRKLLLEYPKLFSLGMVAKENPTHETLRTTNTEFRFYGEGWSKEITRKYSQPKAITEPTDSFMATAINIQDSAYNFTSMCVVQCALLLLNEASKLPSTGGVYTPAFAFHRTSILEALERNGAVFKIVKKCQK